MAIGTTTFNYYALSSTLASAYVHYTDSVFVKKAKVVASVTVKGKIL